MRILYASYYYLGRLIIRVVCVVEETRTGQAQVE